ncbi:MAG: tetratricopeptide repeat protein [Phycisphaerales bacterium]|nr:tetratricopeptide repeat protein [Phycisphaerales bacterium]MCB9857148.1 tetratricopeptide repeat protein [Phycisphaerales bacterium]MCB9861725.1 tetratricopeptide repeat protein [Phycisphaerales bacterium]
MSECLNPEQLEELAKGVLPEDSATALRIHIGECESCKSDFDICLKNEAALGRLKALRPIGAPAEASGAISTDAIPGYEILGELKRGGQGVVYRAMQVSTRREVAVKVMHEGPFAGASDKMRFDREVETLAKLKHPNIVSIHDSGRTASHFYFVMDCIDGLALDAWWSNAINGEAPHLRPMREVLELFASLADAVNAAHLRGIMHRDLKPSNVLVDQADAPHVLDFGLARTTDLDAQGMTMTGQFVGSLPWASPEQAQGIPGTIDIRTDVYSIGVMLYQALTGRFPYDVTGGVRDALDRIVNEMPRRPSLIAPRKIDDELDTIAMKCLAKEPERRYQSAGELGRDLRRYMAGEPIEAKRHSAGYLLRKQLRRHRVPVAMAALLMLAVTIGFIATLALYWRSEQLRGQVETERKAAVAARDAETEQRRLAQTARDRAVSAAERSEAVVEFLQNMLAAVDPDRAGGKKDVRVREIVDTAAKFLDEGGLSGKPEVEAAVRDTIGTTYQGLGLFDEAEKHLSRALEIQRNLKDADPDNLIVALNGLATLLQDKGSLEQSEALFREALTITREHHEPLDMESIKSKNNLAVLLTLRGKFDEASRIIDEIVRLADQLREVDEYAATAVLATAGGLRLQMGDVEGAIPILRHVVESRRKSLGLKNSATTMSINNLGYALMSVGKMEEAEPLIREAIELDEQIFSPDHPQVATDLNNLGLLLADTGRVEESLKVQQRALAIRRKSLPQNHPETIMTLLNLADTFISEGKIRESEPYLREVMQAPPGAWPIGPYVSERIRLRYMLALFGCRKDEEAGRLLRELQADIAANPDMPEEVRNHVAEFALEFDKAVKSSQASGASADE